MIAEDGAWSIQSGEQPTMVNRVVLKEDLTCGGEIRAFRVYAHLPGYREKRVCVYKGDTVGHKAICTFPTIRTAKLTVEVEAGEGDCRLTDMKAFFVK